MASEWGKVEKNDEFYQVENTRVDQSRWMFSVWLPLFTSYTCMIARGQCSFVVRAATTFLTLRHSVACSSSSSSCCCCCNFVLACNTVGRRIRAAAKVKSCFRGANYFFVRTLTFFTSKNEKTRPTNISTSFVRRFREAAAVARGSCSKPLSEDASCLAFVESGDTLSRAGTRRSQAAKTCLHSLVYTGHMVLHAQRKHSHQSRGNSHLSFRHFFIIAARF